MNIFMQELACSDRGKASMLGMPCADVSQQEGTFT